MKIWLNFSSRWTNFIFFFFNIFRLDVDEFTYIQKFQIVANVRADWLAEGGNFPFMNYLSWDDDNDDMWEAAGERVETWACISQRHLNKLGDSEQWNARASDKEGERKVFVDFFK